MLHIVKENGKFEMVRIGANHSDQIMRSRQTYSRKQSIYNVIASELVNDFNLSTAKSGIVNIGKSTLTLARLVQDDTYREKSVVYRIWNTGVVETTNIKPEVTYAEWKERQQK